MFVYIVVTGLSPFNEISGLSLVLIIIMLERNRDSSTTNLVNVTRTWADEHMHGFDLRVEQLVLVQFSHHCKHLKRTCTSGVNNSDHVYAGHTCTLFFHELV